MHRIECRKELGYNKTVDLIVTECELRRARRECGMCDQIGYLCCLLIGLFCWD